MKKIELRNRPGEVALVDDDDYEWLLINGGWTCSAAHNKCLFYAVRRNDETGKQESMHRIIMGLALPDDIPAGMFVDHLDGNGLNNQKHNLEVVPPSVNTRRYHQRRRSCPTEKR